MKLQVLAAAAVLSLSFGTAALADGKVSVQLNAPVAQKTSVIAGGAVFWCEGSSCSAFDAPSRAGTVATCKAVAKKVGAVSSFGIANKSLDSDDLAKCNAAAATQTASR